MLHSQNHQVLRYFSFLLVSCFLSSPISWSAPNDPCPGERGSTVVNFLPDGTTQAGGFVSEQAIVENNDRKIFIGPNAAVCGKSIIHGSVRLEDNAKVIGAYLSGEVVIKNNGTVSNGARVTGKAVIQDDANVFGKVSITDRAVIAQQAVVYNNQETTKDSENPPLATVFDQAIIRGAAEISGDAAIFDQAIVEGDAKVTGGFIGGDAVLTDMANWSEGTIITGKFDGTTKQQAIALAVVDEQATQIKSNRSTNAKAEMEDQSMQGLPPEKADFASATPPTATVPEENLTLSIPQQIAQLLTTAQQEYPMAQEQSQFLAESCGIRIITSGKNFRGVDYHLSYPENTIVDLISYLDNAQIGELTPFHSQKREQLLVDFARDGGNLILQTQQQVSKSVTSLTLHYFHFQPNNALLLFELSQQLQFLCQHPEHPDYPEINE